MGILVSYFLLRTSKLITPVAAEARAMEERADLAERKAQEKAPQEGALGNDPTL